MAASGGPRYAPEDPTLPKPWKGLIDGNTGYLYFWNPETNVTQYERPTAKQQPGPPQKMTSSTVSSSVQVQHSTGYGQQRDLKEDDGRYGGSRGQNQGSRISGSHTQNYMNGTVSDGHGASYSHAHVPTSQTSRTSAKGNGLFDHGGGLTADSYCRQHEITVSGDGIPAPFMTFESTGFPPEILREVHHAGFSSPTPIQAQAWPIALQNRDIVAIAKTGSGKTLGYLLPGFLHLNRLRNNSKLGPTVLVLSPTRELATQILDEAVKFGKSSRISCTCLYGGAPKGPQLRDLDRGVDVVVATPGRLNDILEMRRISLRQVSYLVLDEADRMLDMGFEPQIRKIVKEIPPRRQTLMFTATWPKEVRKIAADLLVSPVQVNIGNIDELVANKAITQYVEVITPMEKQKRLEQILRSQEPGSKVIIFCSTKRMCDQLARSLTRQFGAAAIHGDKSQTERDHVLGQFRTGRSPILVATDVAARGLDIKDIRVVVNFDFPTGIEDYVHRIGRTGRAGATGLAYTFFCDQDSKHASDLIKVLEGASQRVPPEIREMGSRGGYGKFRRWGPGSGPHDTGRSFGGGRTDSGFGGRGGGRGPMPYAGRSEGGFGGRGDRDRHDRSYRNSYDDEMRNRHDTKSMWLSNDRGAGERDLRRSRSRSYSPHRNGSHTVQNYSRSRSRSRSRQRGHSPNKRSHSPNKFAGGAPPGCGLPLDSKREASLDNPRTAQSSPPSNYHLQSSSPTYDDGIPREKSEYGPFPNLGNESARSPSYKPKDNGWHEGGAILGEEQLGGSPVADSRLTNGYNDDPVASAFPPRSGEEEEEGMIPVDEEGPRESGWAPSGMNEA